MKRSTLGRIKALPFIDTVRQLAALVGREDVPDPPPPGVKIICLLPSHPERSPSFHLYPDHWYCYGCLKGGRAVELAAELWDVDLSERGALPLVIERLAATLGLGDDLAAAAVQLRTPAPTSRESAAWLEALSSLEAGVWERVGPYLRCHDPFVRQLAEGPLTFVLEGIADAFLEVAPLTERGRRERVRQLSIWTRDHIAETEGQVKRATGRDLLDVRANAPLPSPHQPALDRFALQMITWLDKKRRRVAAASKEGSKETE